MLGDVEDPATLAAIEGPFDYIVIADTIGMFEDIDGTLRLIHQLCAPSTRIIIAYYSHLWEPILKTGGGAAACGSRQPKINYIATADFLQPDGPRRFRGDQRRSSGNCCRGAGSASGR